MVERLGGEGESYGREAALDRCPLLGVGEAGQLGAQRRLALLAAPADKELGVLGQPEEGLAGGVLGDGPGHA